MGRVSVGMQTRWKSAVEEDTQAVTLRGGGCRCCQYQWKPVTCADKLQFYYC